MCTVPWARVRQSRNTIASLGVTTTTPSAMATSVQTEASTISTRSADQKTLSRQSTAPNAGRNQVANKTNFQKLLNKQCPLHPKAKHSILECISLWKSFHEHTLEDDKKKRASKLTRIKTTLGHKTSNSLPTWSTSSLAEMPLSTSAPRSLHGTKSCHSNPPSALL